MSSPKNALGSVVSAASIAAANSFGPASMGPSRCDGMIVLKSHAATPSAHRLTSSLLRGNASTCRIGGTKMSLSTKF
eukprot:30893-Pelagococcus_subviridis.AAC.5